jgi:hypothetical protein
MPRPDRLSMRPDLRRLADHRQVGMIDPPAARVHQRNRMLDEAGRCRAAPLRVAGREMRADIAFADRAQDGVGQGVEQHVRVAMPLQSAGMRDEEAAQPQLLAVGQRMDVEAGAGAADQCGAEALLGSGEILGQGDFPGRLRPGTGATEMPPAGDLGTSVASRASARRGERQDASKRKGLRGLPATTSSRARCPEPFRHPASVSTTGRTGLRPHAHQAPPSRRSSTRGRKGRAASWIRPVNVPAFAPAPPGRSRRIGAARRR